ncbi:MAG TPA: DUF4837 family protein [Dysgonamonadaceae bacterium]|nr:DUF4837 family protein [Dysgonamonadaceae bacterium]
MKHVTFFISIVALSSVLLSCKKSTRFLSASSMANEVVVVMDEDAWENGEAGRAVYDLLNSPIPALPQPEPHFKILQVTPQNFSTTFKMARNIVIPEISNVYSTPKVTAEIDKYAYGQVILTIKAPDTLSFVNYVEEKKQSILDYLVTKELERTAEWLKEESGTPQKSIREKFGISIHYPPGLTRVTEDKDFYWATNDAARGRQDIVIYQFPYVTEKVFEKDSLIAIRDSILGEHIKGSLDAQMTTSKKYDPLYRRIVIDSIFRAEIRGLWEMTTDMMGGPFVAQAFVNPYTNKVIVVDVFVYAPEGKKRNLLRSLEASFYTISIINPNEQSKEKK